MKSQTISALILTFISSLITMCIFIAIFAKYYKKDYIFEYIWFCNKIYTIKNIVKDSVYNHKIFNEFTSDNKIQGLSTNYYDLLSLTSSNGCKPKHRQCGILDTLEHKLCIDSSYPCPINEIIIDNTAHEYYYLNDGFKIRKDVNYITYNYNFYYTNYSTYGNAIIMLKKTYTKPRYIDYDNLQFDVNFMGKFFDEKASDLTINSKSENSTVPDRRLIAFFDTKEIIEIVASIFSIFEKINELIGKYSETKKFDRFMDFVVKKIEDDENNYDTDFIPIGDNCYVKNYIGFKTNEDIEKFMKLDFSIYKSIFPNEVSSGFAIFGFVVSLAFSIITFIFSLCEDKAIIFIVISFIAHLSFFIGYISYAGNLLSTIYNSKTIEEARTIEADKFITSFLNEFSNQFEDKTLIICVIAFFVISIILEIIALTCGIATC